MAEECGNSKEKIYISIPFTDGTNELYEVDSCRYQEIEAYKNVTIRIKKCKNCGKIEIDWYKQNDTEKIDIEE